MKKQSHPRINEKCERVIAGKNAAEGSNLFEQRRQECQRILADQYKYISANFEWKSHVWQRKAKSGGA